MAPAGNTPSMLPASITSLTCPLILTVQRGLIEGADLIVTLLIHIDEGHRHYRFCRMIHLADQPPELEGILGLALTPIADCERDGTGRALCLRPSVRARCVWGKHGDS